MAPRCLAGNGNASSHTNQTRLYNRQDVAMADTFELTPSDAELAELVFASEAGAGFASLLRALRECACFTQEELAQRSGLSVRAISDLECGRTSTPHRDSVALLAQALRVEGELLEKFRRVARRRIGSAKLRAVSRSALAGAGPHDDRADTVVPPGVFRLVEWMQQVLVEQPAAGCRSDRSGLPAPRMVELVGPPNADVASIAVQSAALFRKHFPDGQYYVSAEAGMCGCDALVGPLSRVLGVGHVSDGMSDQVSRIRSVLHARRVLLVLDNITDPAQVRPLVTIGGASAVIVLTSRRLAVFDGIWTIHVPQ
jgi:transcriptional regulator with XRE-family HTH domain